MSKTATNARRKLLQAGKYLARERGIGALSARALCRQAGVNPGMFHYCFKTKKRFLEELLGEMYAELLGGLAAGTAGGRDCVARLKNALAGLARFAADNRVIAISVLERMLSGDREITALVKKKFTAHILVLEKMITECVREKRFAPVSPPTAFIFLLGSVVAAPNLAARFIGAAGIRRPFGWTRKEFETEISSDGMIEKRIDMAIKALSAEDA